MSSQAINTSSPRTVDRRLPLSLAREQLLGAGLLALALGLALVSVLGPLVLDVIHYRVSETVRDQTVGLDLASLALVAPLTLGVAVLTLRRHPAAPALTLGPAAYAAYMLAQYVLGPEYVRIPGNNERFFLLFLALFVLAGFVGVCAWSMLDVSALPAIDERRARRIGRYLLPLLALAVFGRYLPALVDASGNNPSAGYRAGPTFFWTIALLDLGVFLPTLLATAVGLRHGRPWARKTLWLVSGWLALVGPAVCAMAAAMEIKHDPGSSPGGVVLTGALAVALVAFAVYVYRPLTQWSRTGA
ncbi:MAG TPA: hypothetical protein VFA97_10010 [Gaiellaceae bacterium]|nr:hypothetical protein [Gaiellaceae bacterium]